MDKAKKLPPIPLLWSPPFTSMVSDGGCGHRVYDGRYCILDELAKDEADAIAAGLNLLAESHQRKANDAR